MSKMTIEMYVKLVDQILVNAFDMTTEDLPDQPYYDWMTEGITPRQAAGMVVDSELVELFDGEIRFRF